MTRVHGQLTPWIHTTGSGPHRDMLLGYISVIHSLVGTVQVYVLIWGTDQGVAQMQQEVFPDFETEIPSCGDLSGAAIFPEYKHISQVQRTTSTLRTFTVERIVSGLITRCLIKPHASYHRPVVRHWSMLLSTNLNLFLWTITSVFIIFKIYYLNSNILTYVTA